MRVKLEYYYKKCSDKDTYPFWVKTEVGEHEFVATCGESWDDAKSRHVQRLHDKFNAPTPPIAEEIDL
jgi:hypothetical protein